MAGDALHVAHGRRTFIEMDRVPRRSDDPLPRAVSVLLYMALGANRVRYRRMRTNAVRTFRNPLVQLAHICHHPLAMTIVTAKLRVFAGRELPEGLFHHMTARAESVVVHHEVPARHTGERGAAEYQHQYTGEADLPSARSRFEPSDDLRAPLPYDHR
jgi:hypothetical protein